MKRKHGTFLGIAVLMIAMAFIIAGCDIDGGGSTNNNDTIEKVSFTCGDYSLSIYKNRNRAVYVPETGDRYEIRNSSGNVISSGTITIRADETYTFSPSSGKPDFLGALSPNMTSFQITSAITLDDGSQLPGLSLSTSEDSGKETPVYTSYAAAADAGRLFHNGQISSDLGVMEGLDAVDALMKTLDYTQLKINSNLPIISEFWFNFSGFDFSIIVDELHMQANDYFKWDIQYNDHRILASYYQKDNGNFYKYTLVNEVLLLPEINGGDYSTGTIKHVDYEYGVSDLNDITLDSTVDEFSINEKAPVDNLGLLQIERIVDSVRTARNITLQAGDYLFWKITYSDSKWNIHRFFQIVDADGSIGLWSGTAVKEF